MPGSPSSPACSSSCALRSRRLATWDSSRARFWRRASAWVRAPWASIASWWAWSRCWRACWRASSRAMRVSSRRDSSASRSPESCSMASRASCRTARDSLICSCSCCSWPPASSSSLPSRSRRMVICSRRTWRALTWAFTSPSSRLMRDAWRCTSSRSSSSSATCSRVSSSLAFSSSTRCWPLSISPARLSSSRRRSSTPASWSCSRATVSQSGPSQMPSRVTTDSPAFRRPRSARAAPRSSAA